MEKEIKQIYSSSKGIEYLIKDMPRILVFNIVMKYGKNKLIEDGYELLVERYTNIIKNADVVKIINEMGKQ